MVGGLGLYERKSPVGIYVAPRLLLYYNSIVLGPCDTKYPSKQTSQNLEIMGAIEDALRRSKFLSVLLKNQSSVTDVRLFQSRGWTARVTYTYIVPLTNIPLLWSRMEQNLRRFVNRCTRENLRFSDDDDFDSFFRIHSQTVERKRTMLYLPEQAFRRYFTQLRALGLCRLYHARLPNGQSIATQLVLVGPYVCTHTVCAGAEKEFLSLGANAFLRWKVFESLSQMGFKANDLTDAALNPVTHFKSQFGGDLHACLVVARTNHLMFQAYQFGLNFAEITRRVFRKLTYRFSLPKMHG